MSSKGSLIFVFFLGKNDGFVKNYQIKIKRSDEISIDQITKILEISSETLKSRHRRTATATARNILRVKYPNTCSSLKFSHIDRSIINAIISNWNVELFLRRIFVLDYTKISNSSDEATESKIRRAMSFYFSTMTYKAKTFTGSVMNHVEDNH